MSPDAEDAKVEHVFGDPLTEKDFAALERGGVPRSLAQEAVRRVDSLNGAEMFSRNGSGDYAGQVFLYTWPGEDRIREYRLRRDHPDLELGADGKFKEKNKYVGPPGRKNLLYFAPRTPCEWLEDATLPVIITEGEKKTLALSHLAWHQLGDASDKPRWLAIGLGGVNNWKGRNGKKDGPNGEQLDVKGPIPDLDRIRWTKREVIILFDSNVHTNEDVQIARFSLAKELRKRGAHVLFADIPRELGVNGIDDVIGRKGPDIALGLIQKAYDPKKKKSNTGQPSKIVINEIPSVHSKASEKVEFLVPGLLVKGTITVLSGEASGGKTTLALWLSDLIARGAEIFGECCQQHPVLYLTRENPVDYMADILRRLKVQDGPETNLIIWGDWLEESPPVPAASHILEWVSRCPDSPFVIIDSLIAFFDGANENDAKEMRAFINQGRLLMRAGACGVLFLHHPGKAESAREYRGSSDLKPAIDAGYFMRNSGDGVLERLHLKLFKPRFLAQKREVLLVYGDGGFVSDERPAAVQQSVTEQLKNQLRDLPGCTKTEFENAAQAKGLVRLRARQFLDTGVADKSVRRDKGSRNGFHYTLTEPVN
jgi:hypothetical protein